MKNRKVIKLTLIKKNFQKKNSIRCFKLKNQKFFFNKTNTKN